MFRCLCFLVLGRSDIFGVLLGTHLPRSSTKIMFLSSLLGLIVIVNVVQVCYFDRHGIGQISDTDTCLLYLFFGGKSPIVPGIACAPFDSGCL